MIVNTCTANIFLLPKCRVSFLLVTLRLSNPHLIYKGPECRSALSSDCYWIGSKRFAFKGITPLTTVHIVLTSTVYLSRALLMKSYHTIPMNLEQVRLTHQLVISGYVYYKYYSGECYKQVVMVNKLSIKPTKPTSLFTIKTKRYTHLKVPGYLTN